MTAQQRRILRRLRKLLNEDLVQFHGQPSGEDGTPVPKTARHEDFREVFIEYWRLIRSARRCGLSDHPIVAQAGDPPAIHRRHAKVASKIERMLLSTHYDSLTLEVQRLLRRGLTLNSAYERLRAKQSPLLRPRGGVKPMTKANFYARMARRGLRTPARR